MEKQEEEVDSFLFRQSIACGDVTHFLKSASSFSMSSLDSLLPSCRYKGEKRAFLSSVPDASLNKVLSKGGKGK